MHNLNKDILNQRLIHFSSLQDLAIPFFFHEMTLQIYPGFANGGRLLHSLTYWDDPFHRLTFYICHLSKPYPQLHFSVWKILKPEIEKNTEITKGQVIQGSLKVVETMYEDNTKELAKYTCVTFFSSISTYVSVFLVCLDT